MKRKVKSKSKASASKLKSKHTAKSKLRSRKAVTAKRSPIKARKKPVRAGSKVKSIAEKPSSSSKKIVRIMGHGQFTVDNKTLKRLNEIDNVLVELVSRERSDDGEFRKKLSELNDIVVKNGKTLDPREIVRSDIILPSADLSIDEAKKLFIGEGVIPEI